MSQSLNDIEAQTNYLMSEALDLFYKEKEADNLLIKTVDEHWIVQNYVQLLDSFLGQMWIEFIKNQVANPEDPQSQGHLAKTAFAHKAYVELDKLNDDDKINGEGILDYFQNMKVKSAGEAHSGDFVGGKGETRISYNDYVTNEARFENSLKFLPIWCEAFVITAIIWTFVPLFKSTARAELGKRLEVKMVKAKGDFQTYQKNKKKAATNQVTAAHSAAPGSSTRRSKRGNSVHSSSNASVDFSSSVKSKEGLNPINETTQHSKFGRKFDSEGFLIENEVGFTTDFVNPTLTPMFISEFPFEEGKCDLYGCYFNMDNNTWSRFDFDSQLSRMLLTHQSNV